MTAFKRRYIQDTLTAFKMKVAHVHKSKNAIESRTLGDGPDLKNPI
ncbi:MAG: hypothetical protein WBB27_07945 [Maribacter sp.]